VLRVVGLLGGLLLLTAGAIYALKLPPEHAHAPQPIAQAAALLPEGPSEELSELDQAKAADLKASLALLERAEAERQQKAQLAAAEAEAQRTAAQAAQERETAERDRVRHEQMARELDAKSVQQARQRVQITLYGTDWCGVCERARAYLHANNIPFQDFDIDRNADARARAYALNPRHSVPTIAVDKELLIGFSPDSLEDRIARAARARKL
jgi:glutaredoxin